MKLGTFQHRRFARRSRQAILEAMETRRLLASITVSTLSDVTNPSDGVTSLREAVSYAQPGDSIIFKSGLTGTITLSQGQLTLMQDMAITGPGASTLAISGNNVSRIFWVNSDVSAKISKLTLKNGKGTGNYAAGGVVNVGELAMSDCVVTANSSAVTGQNVYGGGIQNLGTMSMTLCTVSSNVLRAPTGCNAFGGGICNLATLSLSKCTIDSNSVRGSNGTHSGMGGGIYSATGALTLSNCTIKNNTAYGGTAANSTTNNNGGAAMGGGVYVKSAKLTISGTTFSGNNAVGGAGYNNALGASGGGEGLGGGLLIASGVTTPALTSCTFSANKAAGGAGASGAANHGYGAWAYGGGIYCESNAATTSITGCSFTQNAAIGGQGGRRTGLTIADFEAGGQAWGGAICTWAPLTVGTTSFTANAATGGGGNNSGPANGGAIYTKATLNVTASAFVSNGATAGAAMSTNAWAGSAWGGAISSGAVSGTVTRCLFQNNTVTGGKGGPALSSITQSKSAGMGGNGNGGAVAIGGGGGLTVANCTLTANIARGGAGGDGVNDTTATGSSGGSGWGGGVYAPAGISCKVLACTIVGNSAFAGASGAHYIAGGNTTGVGTGGGVVGNKISMGNTIVAANKDDSLWSADVHESVVSLGYNLISRKHVTSSWLASDITGSFASPVDPKLAALADHGGGTKTMALSTGSPAIDKGKALGLTSDQRNMKRPVDQASITNASGGDGSDIGAYEAQASSTTQTPYKGIPFAIGAAAVTIQMEDFDNGGEGVAYHDVDSINSGTAYRTGGVDLQACSDTGGGYNLGWTKAGEWLEYTVNVATAQNYTFDFRVASAALGGTFRILVDGVDKSGALTAIKTGAAQTWQTMTKPYVNLPAGPHVLRVAMETAGSGGSVANFNWMKISPTGGGAAVATIAATVVDKLAVGSAWKALGTE